MLQSRVAASDKRATLRARIDRRELTVMPGAYSPLVARMIERHGFGGVYLSGHMLATSLGLPDIGLTTASELAATAASFARTTDLPVIADADTGFGSPLNAGRTVQMFEDAGIAGCHFEDQADPKRVGGGADVRLVTAEVAAHRLAVAVAARRDPAFLIIARTDAKPVEGLSRAIERIRTYRAAGADLVFVEGIRTADEIRIVVEANVAPLLVNINELASPVLTHAELAQLGVAIAIHPMGLTRLALGSTDAALKLLAAEGNMAALASQMHRPEQMADLLDAASYAAADVP